MIDTGSSKSLINPNVANHFYSNCITTENFLIQTAHGETFHNKIAKIPIFNIFKTTGYHKFYLFNFSNKYHGLIGADLLKHLNADINLKTCLIRTPNATIPIKCEENLSYQYREFNSIDINFIIPARTQKVVEIPVKQKNGFGILDYQNFGNGVEMPNALVEINNYLAKTTLLNSRENPVKINISQPLETEPIDMNEVNFVERMETDQEIDIHRQFFKRKFKKLTP